MSALQELLNLGLVDIGSNDSRFEKMQSAATVFSTRLKEKPDLLIPATLIAIDDEVDENNPLFNLVEELVIAEWPTLRNTHVNRPRELLRSIIIDALMTSINEKPEAAGVIYNTASCPYKFGQIRLGKAAAVVNRMLKDASHIAETEAVKRAGLVTTATKKRRGKKFASEIPSLQLEGTIRDADILTEIERASGPQDAQNQPIKDPNPHWSNAAPNWSHGFAPRMTTALVKAVNLGIQRLAESLSKSLATYLGNVEDHLRDDVRQAEQLCLDISESQKSSRMRLDVLWWSEALYSPLLGCSYRDRELPDAAVAAAIDLGAIVPALSPASVYYVLGETIQRLSRMRGADGARLLISYLDEFKKNQTDFGEAFYHMISGEIRTPLLGLVVEISDGVEPTEELFRSRAGINGSLELSSGEFAMWVFRELQAKRLIEALR